MIRWWLSIDETFENHRVCLEVVLELSPKSDAWQGLNPTLDRLDRSRMMIDSFWHVDFLYESTFLKFANANIGQSWIDKTTIGLHNNDAMKPDDEQKKLVDSFDRCHHGDRCRYWHHACRNSSRWFTCGCQCSSNRLMDECREGPAGSVSIIFSVWMVNPLNLTRASCWQARCQSDQRSFMDSCRSPILASQ